MINFCRNSQEFRNYNETMRICNEILHWCVLSGGNEEFSQTLPVLLTTEWTEYDKEIQKLLGFYTLARPVTDESLYPVYCISRYVLNSSCGS